MAKEPSEAQEEHRTRTFGEIRSEIAARNEQAQKEARELRETHEREKLGIATRRRVNLDQ
ncbi:MAG: hypothetical protein ABSC56_14430 [Solirubrobacteraceae bacterium]|jgi:hypothetical protein